jgi:hypothetical protein
MKAVAKITAAAILLVTALAVILNKEETPSGWSKLDLHQSSTVADLPVEKGARV